MDVFRTLELDSNSNLEDAKKSFRRLSVKFHPDKPGGSSEKFQELVDAYTFLKNHPELLNKESKKSTYSYLHVKLKVTLEDIYFESVKKIKVNKKGFCKDCDGTGSADKKRGICQSCHGTGTVENKILRIMGKKEGIKCPHCNGLGVNPNRLCSICGGNKTVDLEKTYFINITNRALKDRLIIIKEEGNILPDGTTGDLYIKIEIEKEDKYLIEDNKIVRVVLITPTQNIMGDKIVIPIFGKDYRIYIPPQSKYLKIYDNRLNGRFKRTIIIKIVVTKPIFSDRIKELYSQIIAEEKKELNNQEPSSIDYPIASGVS